MAYFKNWVITLVLFALTSGFLGSSLAVAQEKNIEGAAGPRAINFDTFTLYRGSPLDSDLKIYIATFDSIEGANDRIYNSENCDRAVAAFKNDPGFFGAPLFCKNGYHESHPFNDSPSLWTATKHSANTLWSKLKSKSRLLGFAFVLLILMGIGVFRKAN